jgi:cation/acetate symporter
VANRSLSLTLFCVLIAVTLGITWWASRRTRTATDFYAAGRRVSAWQNGVALAGDYLSAASFLGIAGLIALYGYDGLLYSVGFLVAYLMVLLLVAEPLRNTGEYTMADVLAYRLRQRPVRAAVALSTVSVSVFYLVAQMVGAGALVSLLLGLRGGSAALWPIVGIGVLMIVYVAFGGMIGTTWVQIVKSILLLSATLALSVLVLARFGFSPDVLFARAAASSGKGQAFLAPGQLYRNGLDLVSLGLALVLGTAGLPHVLTRCYTVASARAARSSVNWAIGVIGGFYLLTTFLGFGAAALVGEQAISAAQPSGNMAAPLLARQLGGGNATFGGDVLLAAVAAVAFATILAVVAGLVMTASSSFAHDFYAGVLLQRRAGAGNPAPERDEAGEVRVARLTVLAIGAVAIVVGIGFRDQNVAFLVGLAFAIAASANLPTLLLSMYWRRFSTAGAVVGTLAGLGSCLLLVVVGPAVLGPHGIWLHRAHPLFPLENPGIVSIPLSFLAAWSASLLRPEPAAEAMHDALRLRALAGVGAEERPARAAD